MPVEFTMVDVQTVRLCDNALFRCFSGEVELEVLRRYEKTWTQFPSWLQAYNKINYTYKECLCKALDIPSYDTNEIQQRLSDYAGIRLQLKPDSPLETFLYYHPHLRQWLIIYQLTFFAEESDLEQAVQSLENVKESRCLGPYHAVRDSFVESDGINRKLELVNQAEAQVKSLIAEVIEQLYGWHTGKPDSEIEIVNSSGNITLFVNSDGTSPQCKSTLTRLHELSDRIGSDARDHLLTIPGIDLYIFWGRFHTVLSSSPSETMDRFMPIHFQAQLLWSYLSAANLVSQDVEEEILTKSFGRFGNEAFLDAMINSVQYCHFMNEGFIRSIEGDYELLYRKIESRWHLDKSLVRMNDFTAFLAKYVDREYQKKALASDEKQGKLLNAIALLGVFALIETWGSYLDLMAGSEYSEAFASTPLGWMIGNPETLTMFNTWFPLLVFIVLLAGIIYIFAKK